MTKLEIGQTVLNFGIVAKVVAFHEATGEPILRAHDLRMNGEKWLAAADKCEVLDNSPAQGYQHENGLVTFL